MKRTILTLCLSASVAAVFAGAAAAEGQQRQACGQRDRVIAKLADRYGEVRRSIGLGAKNRVVETWASAETGTWTITVTHPNGLTCLVASGQAFEAVDETLAQGNDA